ncbi:MAG: HAD family hydrolase [bacterium]
MIRIEIPGFKTIEIDNLVLDFNGTIALDGNLVDGVDGRLVSLSHLVNIHIVTADTFGLVETSCSGLPVKIQKIPPGEEADRKRILLERMGCGHTAAMGNGANDVQMLERACLGIAVLGKEGTCTAALKAADICVPDACTGLDLLLFPKRITATLRY